MSALEPVPRPLTLKTKRGISPYHSERLVFVDSVSKIEKKGYSGTPKKKVKVFSHGSGERQNSSFRYDLWYDLYIHRAHPKTFSVFATSASLPTDLELEEPPSFFFFF